MGRTGIQVGPNHRGHAFVYIFFIDTEESAYVHPMSSCETSTSRRGHISSFSIDITKCQEHFPKVQRLLPSTLGTSNRI